MYVRKCICSGIVDNNPSANTLCEVQQRETEEGSGCGLMALIPN